MIHYSMKCPFIYIHGQTDFQIPGTEPALVLNYRETDSVKGIHFVPRATVVFIFTFEHQNLLEKGDGEPCRWKHHQEACY